jgi:hypothetical protein
MKTRTKLDTVADQLSGIMSIYDPFDENCSYDWKDEERVKLGFCLDVVNDKESLDALDSTEIDYLISMAGDSNNLFCLQNHSAWARSTDTKTYIGQLEKMYRDLSRHWIERELYSIAQQTLCEEIKSLKVKMPITFFPPK